MKSKLIILTMSLMLASVSGVFAGGDHDHGVHEEATQAEEISSDAVNVDNTICPVSGEFISDVGEGKGVKIEHEGKVYNVCCKFCAKDFRKDPEKFIKVIKNNLAEGKDPGRDYASDPDEELEPDEGDHEDSGHGEHDHEYDGAHDQGHE